MSKLRNLTALAGLVAVAILAAGWFLLVSPQNAKAAAYKSQAASTRSNSTTLQAQLDMLKAQKRDLPKQRARLAAIAEKVPNNPAEPALVRALTKAADDAGVDLTSIAPATPQRLAAPVAAAAGAVSGAAVQPAGVQVAGIALKIMAVGTYFQLEQFQANLEAMTRALKTVGITLVPGDGPMAKSASTTATTPGGAPVPVGYDGQLTATISANVYMTIESASLAPLTGAAATAPAPTK